MKILYVNEDRHENILKAFANPENDNIYLLPCTIDGLIGKQYIGKAFSKLYPNNRYNLLYRFYLMKEVLKISRLEKPDIIHFVSADEMLKIFGFGLSLLKKNRIVLTLHWAKKSRLRDFSRIVLSKRVDYIIFHSISAPIYLAQQGIQNTSYIILPAEHTGMIYEKNEAKKSLNIDTNNKIIAMVGTLEDYKGFDILLEALQLVKEPFYLLVAGKPKKYTLSYINKMIEPYKDNVKLMLEYINDEQFIQSICCADIVVLPYRKSFEATSGPMTEAIRCHKTIIAPDYGNLGYLTEKYNLGYLFKSENVSSLAKVISKALIEDFIIDYDYEEYFTGLNIKEYCRSQQDIYEKILN